MEKCIIYILILGVIGFGCNVKHESNSNFNPTTTDSSRINIDTIEKNVFPRIINQKIISNLIAVNQSKDTSAIINKLLKAINEEEIAQGAKYKIFDLIYEDLDGDSEKEILINCGEERNNTQVIVLDKLQKDWSCIFNEEFGHLYSGVFFETLETANGERIFFLNNLEERGSGIHKTAIYFFRIMENEIVPALRTLSTAYINGWGLYINQDVNGEFKYDSSKDEIKVTYNYSFYPGPVMEGDVSWESHPEIELIKGDLKLSYKWDMLNKKYIAKNMTDKIENKIRMFDDFGNDSIFTLAFKTELDSLANSNQPILSDLVKKYLKKTQKGKDTKTHDLQLLKRNSDEGGLNFYGDKQNK